MVKRKGDLDDRNPPAPRKKPTCSCCNQPKSKGHSLVCNHELRTCRKCKVEKEARRQELLQTLDALGLTLRSDSELCKMYINGTVAQNTNGKFSTAAQVSLRMAQVHYLRGGYCAAYNREVEEIQKAVDDEIEKEAEDNRTDTWDGYYSGITATCVREVYGNGFYSMRDVENDITLGWKSFPDTWPWLNSSRQ